MKMYICKLCC